MQHIDSTQANVIIEDRNFRTVLNRCWDVPRRIADMTEQGVDKQVLSPMPRLLAYELDPSDGLDLARYLNEIIAQMIEHSPNQFYGLGSVPLQNVDLAAKELHHVKSLGLQGVEVLTNINGRNLGDPEFRPFLKEAETLGMAIFSHAQNPTFAERMIGPEPVQNAVGFPIENGLALANVITSGVLVDCPKLRICFSHGGGVFTQLLPRLENAWNRPGPLKDLLPESPTTYAQTCFYDDIFFNNITLRYLLDIVGTTQVMIGSDYPFGWLEQRPEDEFAALKLTPSEVEAISYVNCLRFLGLET